MRNDKLPLDQEEESVQKKEEPVDAESAGSTKEVQEKRTGSRSQRAEAVSKTQRPGKRPRKEVALRTKIKQLEAQLEEKQDQLLRLAAEFENHRRRTLRDFEHLIRNASENVITQLVPIIDDFERALDHAKTTDDFGSLHQGVEMILNHLKDVLQKEGLRPMEVVGKPFDPNYHEALMQTEDDTYDSGVIVQETERGYLLNDKVIRPAKVIVNK